MIFNLRKRDDRGIMPCCYESWGGGDWKMQQPTDVLLANSRLFDKLSKEDIRSIVEKTPIIKLSQNQVLFSKNDPADAVFVVANGEIAIEAASLDGRTLRMSTQRTGDVFGELAVLDNGLRTADARATTTALVLKISRNIFLGLVANNSAFTHSIVVDLVGNLRRISAQIEDLSFRPLKERVSLLLLDLFEEVGDHSTDIKITQSEIAERLSATREKVNARLQEIKRAGAISIHRGRIKIVDIDRLEFFADSQSQ